MNKSELLKIITATTGTTPSETKVKGRFEPKTTVYSLY